MMKYTKKMGLNEIKTFVKVLWSLRKVSFDYNDGSKNNSRCLLLFFVPSFTLN